MNKIKSMNGLTPGHSLMALEGCSESSSLSSTSFMSLGSLLLRWPRMRAFPALSIWLRSLLICLLEDFRCAIC